MRLNRNVYALIGFSVLAWLLVVQGAAVADTFTFERSGLIRDQPNTDHLIGDAEPIPPQYVGQTCDVTAVTDNAESVNPDNNLLIATGGVALFIPDVEQVSGYSATASAELLLGSSFTVTVELGDGKLGQDGKQTYSGGVTVTVDCEKETPSTTSTSTMVTTVPPSSTTTTSSPPTTPTSSSTTITSTTVSVPPSVTSSSTEPPPPCIPVDEGTDEDKDGKDDKTGRPFCSPVTGADLGDFTLFGIGSTVAGLLLLLLWRTQRHAVRYVFAQALPTIREPRLPF